MLFVKEKVFRMILWVVILSIERKRKIGRVWKMLKYYFEGLIREVKKLKLL